MKKILLVVLLIISYGTQAQDFWTQKASFESDSEYYKPLLSVPDNNIVWVVTTENYGTATVTKKWHRSNDGGTTWTTAAFDLDNTDLFVYSIFALSETTAYVTANEENASDSGLFKTTDGGQTWTRQNGLYGLTDAFARSVYFWDDNNGIVYGDPQNGYFEIYTTTDGGANWTRIATENIPASMLSEYTRDYTVSGNTIWFSTNHERIFKSSDMGEHWQVSISPIADISAVVKHQYLAFKNQNDGVLTSNMSQHYRTDDGGQTWESLGEIENEIARDKNVWYIPGTENSYFFTGFDENSAPGTSFSTDGGLTFNDMTYSDETPVSITQAHFKNSDFAYAIGIYIFEGSNTTHFKLFKHDQTNAGYPSDLWKEEFPFQQFTTYRANRIAIANEQVVWLQGSHQSNYTLSQRWSRSSNGGSSWTDGTINVGNTSLLITCISAVSETTAYVTAASNANGTGSPLGGVWQTQDSGATWTKQTSALYNTGFSYPSIIHFWDADSGVVIGRPENGYFEIYTTADGGANWTRVPAANFAVPTSWTFPLTNYEVRGNSIWFVDSADQVHRSEDKGLHWTLCANIPRDTAGIYYTHVAFKSPTEGLYQRTDSILAKTDNSGDNWMPVVLEEVPEGEVNPFRNEGIEYVTGTADTYYAWDGSGASYSVNGGHLWHDLSQQDTHPVHPYSAEFYSPQVGYCIGRYDGDPSIPRFFRLKNPQRLLQNQNFDKAQNQQPIAFPNPTNGMVKIVGVRINTVSVFDISGKRILNQKFDTVSETSIDLSALQNGIYFARITDANGSASTLKIIKN